MIEWILILTMNIVSEQKNLRDVQFQIIDGYTSKENCETSGKFIAERLIVQVGKYRKAQGIEHNGSIVNFPSVYTECVATKK